jgi:hypothetical protein
MQGLINTSLIGAERTATLQHERDALAAFGPPAAEGMNGLRPSYLLLHDALPEDAVRMGGRT